MLGYFFLIAVISLVWKNIMFAMLSLLVMTLIVVKSELIDAIYRARLKWVVLVLELLGKVERVMHLDSF